MKFNKIKVGERFIVHDSKGNTSVWEKIYQKKIYNLSDNVNAHLISGLYKDNVVFSHCKEHYNFFVPDYDIEKIKNDKSYTLM